MIPIKVAVSFVFVALGLGLMWVGLLFTWLSAKSGAAAKWVLAP
jgi:hypothetical protein